MAQCEDGAVVTQFELLFRALKENDARIREMEKNYQRMRHMFINNRTKREARRVMAETQLVQRWAFEVRSEKVEHSAGSACQFF